MAWGRTDAERGGADRPGRWHAHAVSRWVFVAVLAGSVVPGPAAQAPDPPLPPLQHVLSEARKRLRLDDDLLRQYTYTQTVRRREQKSGGVTRIAEKVYQVYPDPEPDAGLEYRRLIAEDGKPVPASELEKQDREHQKRVREWSAKRSRESAQDRQKREAKAERERREQDEVIDDALRLFEFRLLGRERIDGVATIVVGFAPRPGVKARTDYGKYLTKLEGRAWLAADEYEMVRLELVSRDTISVGLGIVARLHKGARIDVTRRKINGEIWLPSHVTVVGSGRVLLLKGLRIDDSTEYTDYKKFDVETSTTFGDPVTRRPPGPF